jgi:hypothetical protein
VCWLWQASVICPGKWPRIRELIFLQLRRGRVMAVLGTEVIFRGNSFQIECKLSEGGDSRELLDIAVQLEKLAVVLSSTSAMERDHVIEWCGSGPSFRGQENAWFLTHSNDTCSQQATKCSLCLAALSRTSRRNQDRQHRHAAQESTQRNVFSNGTRHSQLVLLV